ncbi:MAG: alpha/beta hydrolase [Alphaproteobacteria bacterium]|nr:MAG: alpha/beta hydrolase [Alphaproteobacteria bacterium]
MNDQTSLIPAPVRDSISVPGRGDFSILRWDGDSDKPLLVFCHATGFNAQTYTSLLSPLADQFRIIAVDQRGHGFSDAPKDLADLKGWHTYGDDLIGIMTVIDEPAFLSGHSMGGTVSLMMAAGRPDLALGLLLVEPVLIPPTVGRFMALSHLIGRPIKSPLSIGAARRRAEFASREAMLSSYQGRGAFATWPDVFIKDYVDGGSHVISDDKTVLACAPAWESKTFTMASHKIWRQIGNVTCPTKILFAETNSTMRGGAESTIRAKQPDWTIEQVAGASHFLPMEFPELVRENLLNLAGLS